MVRAQHCIIGTYPLYFLLVLVSRVPWGWCFVLAFVQLSLRATGPPKPHARCRRWRTQGPPRPAACASRRGAQQAASASARSWRGSAPRVWSSRTSGHVPRGRTVLPSKAVAARQEQAAKRQGRARRCRVMQCITPDDWLRWCSVLLVFLHVLACGRGNACLVEAVGKA